ncbi:MAG: DUF4403 family protein [Salibacteraceae bacterium]|jgi:hypothetical protein|nr:DUF4403 family protein [Salibacteraceae bacterium]MDP4687345.1 DUF4403 family protein [Salibacteraceae bacterium]MDP4843873.1 DUF4403 family protein [Salibacteraceae bacterium]MDP4964766.1 DUF4403 family protein [Salibacteraceae bacterium]
MRWKISIFICSSLFFLSSCANDDNGNKRTGTLPDEVDYEMQVSRLNLPIQIPLSELQSAINRKLPKEIISGFNIKGNYKLNATRKGNIKMVGDAKNLLWSLPILIEIVKEKNDKVISTFEILPTFKSEIGIEKDYTLTAKSSLIELTFTDSASLKLLGIQFDITKIVANQIVKNTSALTEKIDAEINKISIEKLLYKTWSKLRSPIRVNKQLFKVYILGTPTSAIFHDYYFKNDNIYLDLTLNAVLETVFDSASFVPDDFEYPPLSIKTRQEKGFELHLGLPIEYQLIDSLSNKLLTNKPFEVEGEKLMMDSIHVSALDSFLVIYAKIKGDWDAEMEVYGRPSYNAETKTIFIKGFDFYIKDESSSIFQATDYLFHEEIKQEVLDRLAFDVGWLIDSLPILIYGAIEKGRSGDNLNLVTNISEASVSKVLIGANQLVILLHGNGEVKLEVERIKIRK